MARGNRKKKRKTQPKVNFDCPIHITGSADLNYKNVYSKRKKFITTRGRMISSSRTGVCNTCQRKLKTAVKRARYMAILPYANYV